MTAQRRRLRLAGDRSPRRPACADPAAWLPAASRRWRAVRSGSSAPLAAGNGLSRYTVHTPGPPRRFPTRTPAGEDGAPHGALSVLLQLRSHTLADPQQRARNRQLWRKRNRLQGSPRTETRALVSPPSVQAGWRRRRRRRHGAEGAAEAATLQKRVPEPRPSARKGPGEELRQLTVAPAPAAPAAPARSYLSLRLRRLAPARRLSLAEL